MRRRSLLTVLVVALLTVGWSVVTNPPGGSALAADPEAQLAATRAALEDARASQRRLQDTLAQQRAELAQLKSQSAELGNRLDTARAELAAVTAEYDRVRGLLLQVREQVAAIEARVA